jgi:hypothetical protein
MAMIEDVFEGEGDVSHVPNLPPLADLNPPFDPSKFEPLISLNALTGFSVPKPST